MSSYAITHTAPPRLRRWLAVALPLWFVAALSTGLAGGFAGTPPAPLGAAALVPVLAFLVALAASRAVRRFVGSLDLRILTLAQSWRVIGVVFVALWAAGELPAGFALPAGLGDMVIGVTAPIVAARVVPRLPGRVRVYLAWTALGMLDLVVAVSSGILLSGIGGASAAVTTGPMGTVPLSLVPTFFVPLTMILHVAAAYRVLTRPAPSDLDR